MYIVQPGSATTNSNSVLVPLDEHARRAPLAGNGVAHLDRHLDDAPPAASATGGCGCGQAVALDGDRRTCRRYG